MPGRYSGYIVSTRAVDFLQPTSTRYVRNYDPLRKVGYTGLPCVLATGPAPLRYSPYRSSPFSPSLRPWRPSRFYSPFSPPLARCDLGSSAASILGRHQWPSPASDGRHAVPATRRLRSNASSWEWASLEASAVHWKPGLAHHVTGSPVPTRSAPQCIVQGNRLDSRMPSAQIP